MEKSSRRFLVLLGVVALSTLPSLALAEESAPATPAPAADNAKSEAAKPVTPPKAPDAPKEADAPFVDRDGDGINDAMQHRFRRNNRAKQGTKNGDNDKRRQMKGRNSESKGGGANGSGNGAGGKGNN